MKHHEYKDYIRSRKDLGPDQKKISIQDDLRRRKNTGGKRNYSLTSTKVSDYDKHGLDIIGKYEHNDIDFVVVRIKNNNWVVNTQSMTVIGTPSKTLHEAIPDEVREIIVNIERDEQTYMYISSIFYIDEGFAKYESELFEKENLNKEVYACVRVSENGYQGYLAPIKRYSDNHFAVLGYRSRKTELFNDPEKARNGIIKMLDDMDTN